MDIVLKALKGVGRELSLKSKFESYVKCHFTEIWSISLIVDRKITLIGS